MKSQHILVLISIALLISSALANDSDKSKRKKYRIVKIYGRKLKPTGPPPAQESSFLMPDTSESRIQNSSFKTNGRDMVRPHQHRGLANNVVNVGEMDLNNFDVNKILAAAGHSGSAGHVPTVVQFSAPSSNSHLDPEYLSKLIREQLGQEAEFTVLPSVGGEGEYGIPPQKDHQETYSAPPPSPQPVSPRPVYSAQVSSFSKYSTPAPQWLEYTYPTQVVKTHYSGRTVSPVKDYNGALQSSHSTPVASSQTASKEVPSIYSYTKYNSGPSNTQNYRQPPSKQHSPPLSSYSAPTRQYATMKPYVLSSPTPSYESVSVAPSKRYPYQPPSPNSNIQGYSPPAITTPESFSLPHKEFSYSTKAPFVFSSSSYSTLAPTKPSRPNDFKSQDSYASVALPDSNQVNSGYSTLGREMSAPGMAPAPKGEYGVPDNPSSYSLPNDSGSKSKYAKSLIRGFTSNSNQDSNSNNYRAEAYTAPKPSYQEKWRAVEPTATYVFPKNNYKSPSPASSNGNDYFWTKGSSATYDQSSQTFSSPSPSPTYSSEEFNSYNSQPASSYQSNEGSSLYTGYHPSVDNATPETYETYSPPKNPSNTYGPAPAPNPTYEPSVEEKRPVLSKTIYVNLPAEPTTPKPYRPPVPPQRHYKIVFIKAPTAAPPEEPEIETTPAPESKTFIYVLHKKPEPQKKIVIPTPAPTQPSKPEVHFIQYKEDEPTTTTVRSNSYDFNPDDFSDEFIPSSFSNFQDDDGEFGYKNSYSGRGSRSSPSESDVHYDMSSSSSTIHVNMKKSVSDQK